MTKNLFVANHKMQLSFHSELDFIKINMVRYSLSSPNGSSATHHSRISDEAPLLKRQKPHDSTYATLCHPRVCGDPGQINCYD